LDVCSPSLVLLLLTIGMDHFAGGGPVILVLETSTHFSTANTIVGKIQHMSRPVWAWILVSGTSMTVREGAASSTQN
jgi:hypothetical protein